MDLDSLFPAIYINEPIDLYPMKNYFLVAVPNFIVLGTPQFYGNSVTFCENSYIKIQPSYYSEWKNFLLNSFKIVGSNDLNDKDDTSLVDYETFKISWNLKDKIFHIQIKDHEKNQTSITVDIIELQNIYSGICALFFKPLCLPNYVVFAFKVCEETQSLLKIRRVKYIKDAVKLIKNMDVFENDYSKILLTAEHVLRFQNELIIYKKLCNKSIHYTEITDQN